MNKEMVARKVIERNGDKFMTITFVKKDGTVRTLNGRTGVFSGLKGTGHASDTVITVWDRNAKGYRSVIPSSISTISSRGFKYNVSIFEEQE